ncbi:MAG: trmB [Verrucomicrobia bacterium]|jgi:tRNA (guanine-N7-)-methyltransferase|nr:trmB [Verrucomicrobiota bacterium]
MSETVATTTSPTLVHRPRSFFEPLNIGEMFSKPQPLQVEIGAGDGSFLIKYTSLHPEYNFLGVERLLGRLRKIDRKGQRQGLQNLRGLRIEAAYFVEYLLPADSTDIIHIYFPDPWPKKKHRKNRLVNERFTELAHRVLKDRGIVYLRTDDADYHEQMVTVFDANPRFERIETPEELSAVKTDFERGFNAEGIPTRYAAYRRR